MKNLSMPYSKSENIHGEIQKEFSRFAVLLKDLTVSINISLLYYFFFPAEELWAFAGISRQQNSDLTAGKQLFSL